MSCSAGAAKCNREKLEMCASKQHRLEDQDRKCKLCVSVWVSECPHVIPKFVYLTLQTELHYLFGLFIIYIGNKYIGGGKRVDVMWNGIPDELTGRIH